MTRTFDIVVVTFVLFVQVLIVLPGAVNLAKVPYRQRERADALKVYSDNPSPETKAAFQEELRLVSRYVTRRQLAKSGILFSILLVLDGVVIYYLRRHGKREARA